MTEATFSEDPWPSTDVEEAENIWGEIDVEDVDENVGVGEGTHPVIVTSAYFMELADQGESLTPHRLIINFKVVDEDSKFDGRTRSEWFNVYPASTHGKSWLETIPPKQQGQVEADKARMRKRFRQLGLETDDVRRLARVGGKWDEANALLKELIVDLEGDLVIFEQKSKKQGDDRVFYNIKEFVKYGSNQ